MDLTAVAAQRDTVVLGGGALALVLHLPGASARVPCVVACHGLSASKDSDKYLLLGAEFAKAGLALARFDFRGCGESTGREDETTVATRIEDAQAILHRLTGHPRLDGRFALLGSSMGGFVALHVAAARVDALPVVTWNAPANLLALTRTDTEDGAGVGQPLLDELTSRRYAFAPAGVPRHLVIHADADDVVPLAHGRLLFAQAAEPRELAVIAGGDHRLTDPAHRADAVRRSLTWFLRFLV